MSPELSEKVFAPGLDINESGAARELCRWR